MTPRILIVAGSDSGGGAGIQADMKTVTMLGGHAMTAITAITAQNTIGVQAVQAIPSGMVVAQMRSCIDDIGVDAVKIGMIGSADTAHAVADVLERLDVPIVFDPVMVSTSGAVLADSATTAAFARLMALAVVVTPNVSELAALTGSVCDSEDDRVSAARALAGRCGSAVLAKGGDASGAVLVDTLVFAGGEVARWEAPRIDTRSTHGTGCTLASAIATNLARGASLQASVARARRFVRLALHDAPGFGQGHGPMAQQAVRLDSGEGPRLNQVTLPLRDYDASVAFYTALGLRQIVATDDGRYARFESAGGATLSIGHADRASVYFEHEDLDAAIDAAQRLGLTFASPSDQSWLWREAWTSDPAGNPVCFYQADEDRRFPPWRV